MAIVYRSADVAEGDREEVTRAAFLEQSWPTTVELDEPRTPDSFIEVFSYGRASIFRAQMTGVHLSRSARQVRSSPADVLAIAVQERSTARHQMYGEQRLVAPRDLMVNDMNSPYVYAWPGRGSSRALYVPLEELDLPTEVTRVASTRLAASPLYPLLRAHIDQMTDLGDHVAADPIAAETVGAAAIDLARALLASAYDLDYGRAAMSDVLLPRVRGYVRRHLGDPDLSPAMIAAAHDISVRKLFALCADANFSLEQWILANRLDGIRDALARPEYRHRSVAQISRQWGLTNASHVSRRFREAFGMTPRAWRHLALDPVE
ncbi:helix-turn-helix domain-containing protein [Gordonia rhizosphera]|uniref:Putative AraC family transcriptional regulator n=1 Tax=Gordonia rhizosphera NBRC 16068 TaxID=1108045 RepID=K6VMV6_9ACTN|nr:helix-turn-helix domain-containing protein [Gordonia rhizosphera]GAB88230.1 putative AraC family transcriptional regulator [Gordonia rhizosphera NBRC 16068]